MTERTERTERTYRTYKQRLTSLLVRCPDPQGMHMRDLLSDPSMTPGADPSSKETYILRGIRQAVADGSVLEKENGYFCINWDKLNARAMGRGTSRREGDDR